MRRIRSQRAFSIQMPDQYVFCHFAIIEHGMQEGVVGDVDWTGFDDSDSDMSDWGHLHFTHHGTQWDKVCHVVQCFDVCHLKKGSHVIMPHDGICFCYDLINVIDILFVLFIFFLYKFIWYFCSRFVSFEFFFCIALEQCVDYIFSITLLGKPPLYKMNHLLVLH